MYPVQSSVLAKLPSLAVSMWASRKESIANTARQLSRRMNEQTTLNRRLIESKLKGEISQADFDTMKESIDSELAAIESERKALDSQASTMEALIREKDQQPVRYNDVWNRGTLAQKIEMQRAFFPEGIFVTPENHFFEPRNTAFLQAFNSMLEYMSEVGVPDGI
jgi:uncharacterized protein (DUF3084 family)